MIIKQLNFISAVLRLRAAFHAVNTVAALYSVSKDEWLKCVNPDDETHYIKDYQIDGRKSDAIINYTTAVAAVYMGAVGALPGTLSKETLASDNAITVAIMRRLAGLVINSNQEMFVHVATRLLGIDADLVRAGMTTDEVRYTFLVTFLVNALGEAVTEESQSMIGGYIAKRGVEEGLTDEFFSLMLSHGDEYYAEEPQNMLDAIDVIELVIERIKAEEAK